MIVSPAGKSILLLYTYGNKLSQAIPGTMVAKSISKETQPGRLSLCVKRRSPALMSSEERCHFERRMLGHLHSPPHRLPEKDIKGGFSGERFTIYT